MHFRIVPFNWIRTIILNTRKQMFTLLLLLMPNQFKILPQLRFSRNSCKNDTTASASWVECYFCIFKTLDVPIPSLHKIWLLSRLNGVIADMWESYSVGLLAPKLIVFEWRTSFQQRYIARRIYSEFWSRRVFFVSVILDVNSWTFNLVQNTIPICFCHRVLI